MNRIVSAFRRGLWCFAVGVILCGLSGCPAWQTHDDGLRNADLSDACRQARTAGDKGSAKDSSKNDSYDPWMSEKANQIRQNLE
jgi:hypothetical protein